MAVSLEEWLAVRGRTANAWRSQITLSRVIIQPILAICRGFPAFARLRYRCRWKNATSSSKKVHHENAKERKDEKDRTSEPFIELTVRNLLRATALPYLRSLPLASSPLGPHRQRPTLRPDDGRRTRRRCTSCRRPLPLGRRPRHPQKPGSG